MRSGQDVLPDSPFLAGEWMLANGAGGSALGTAGGGAHPPCHALLNAADRNGRVTTVLLGIEERLHVEGRAFALHPASGAANTADPGDADTPDAGVTLEAFSRDPWPTWRYRVAGLAVEKSLFLIHGHQAVAVVYRHLSGPGARLTLSPLVVARDPGGIQRPSPAIQGAVGGIPGRVRIETCSGRPGVTLWHGGTFVPSRTWRRASARGRDSKSGASEDALVPGQIEAPLLPDQAVHLVAATDEGLFRALAAEGLLGAPPPGTLAGCVAMLGGAERARRRSALAAGIRGADVTARQAAAAHGDQDLARRAEPMLDESDPWTARLVRAVEIGIVRRGRRVTVVDSYPEAEERGVAALRALPGLVAIRAFDVVRSVVSGYAEYLDEGLAPEGFDPRDGMPRHGDPEPSLWLVTAAELLARRSEDLDPVRGDLYARLEGVVQAYRAGARAGVRVDADGLLAVADEEPEGGRAASWGPPGLGPGESGTARLRKPARLNVLWYRALVALAQLARQLGRKENAAFYLAWARQHLTSFHEAFWDEGRGCLHAALEERGPVTGLSPSQLWTVSLPPAMLSPERGARLLGRVERDLFTPLGLRPAPGARRADPAWLGPFYAAYLRIHGRGPEPRMRVRGWLEALRNRLDRDAIDHVPACFEWPLGPRGRTRRAAASPPGWDAARPAGASALAASELLRAWVEDLAPAAERDAVPLP